MFHTKNILNRMMGLSLLASLGLVALLSLAQTNAAFAVGTPPTPGDWQSFGVLGGQSVTNTGNSLITGNLGVSPGNTITGFPPGIVVAPGTTHAADALAGSAQTSLVTAYNDLAGQTCDFGPFGPTDLSTISPLSPGVYCFSSTVQNSGILTLASTGAGDIWVFKVGSALTTGPGSSVVMTGPANPCNVFWQITSSATLDTTTTFIGNILALQSISMNNAATISGRVLARNGSVTFINNTINTNGCAGAPPPGGVGVFKVFSPSTISPGGVSTLTITLTNTTGLATLSSPFTDTLPPGMVIASTPNAGTTCGNGGIGGGVASAIANGNTVSLSTNSTIPLGTPAIPGFCTLTVNVTAAAVGSFLNTLPVLHTDVGDSPSPGPGVLLNAVSPTAVPTLNEWGVIIFMLLAGLGSIYYLRKYRKV